MIILFGIGNIAEKTIIKYKLDPKKYFLQIIVKYYGTKNGIILK